MGEKKGFDVIHRSSWTSIAFLSYDCVEFSLPVFGRSERESYSLSRDESLTEAASAPSAAPMETSSRRKVRRVLARRRKATFPFDERRFRSCSLPGPLLYSLLSPGTLLAYLSIITFLRSLFFPSPKLSRSKSPRGDTTFSTVASTLKKDRRKRLSFYEIGYIPISKDKARGRGRCALSAITG